MRYAIEFVEVGDEVHAERVVEQGLQFTCIPLCKDCHQGSHNGIHGRKAIWNVTKKTEMSVLNDTIETLTR